MVKYHKRNFILIREISENWSKLEESSKFVVLDLCPSPAS